MCSGTRGEGISGRRGVIRKARLPDVLGELQVVWSLA